MNKSLFKVFSSITILALMLMALPMQNVQAAGGGSGSVSLTTLGIAYTQDFNTLANTGSTNNLIINGWYLNETGSSTTNNGLYNTGTGSGNAGDTYSFGATASTERAIGGLLSGTLTPTIGAQFTNNTGSTVTALDISYIGEMWRAGVLNRGAADRLDFQLSTDATSLDTGTWSDYDSLDFNSPNLLAAIGTLNGNSSENQTPVSFSITGLSIPNGSSFWIRWTDFNISSSDDGLAIDDFSLRPVGGGGGPSTNVIINEVDSDTPGTDALEFVELYDGGVGNTALDGLVVVFYNGSNDLSYASYDLDGFSTDANGYFVLGNAGVVPTPSIIFSNNFLQNGADAVALFADDAANFPTNTAITTTNLLDAIVYDTNDADDTGLLVLLNAAQPQVDENGGGDGAGQSNQRCPNGSGGARNTDTYTQETPTPGSENCPPPPPEACGDAFTPIYAVQGNGAASPLVGTEVAIEGIVVGDFQNNASVDNGNLNGFHVQDPFGDGDAATSDGVFVYAPGGIDVAVGDAVRVRGSISEFNGLTEITAAQVWGCSTGNALPAPVELSLPVTSADDFEAYEGMFVTFPQALVISEYFNYDRFGEIVLTSQRHLTPTAEFEPGSPEEMQAVQDFLLDKITLDDGRSNQNPDPAIHPNGNVFDLSNLFRGGDTVANVTGVMDYSFSLYRIQPTQGADYTSVNPRPAQPGVVGGNLKVVSMNTLNYFSTLTNSGSICGPLQNQDCRGADTPEEFTRQRDKIIAAISTLNADVIGLLEIENNINDEALQNLVDGLNTALGAGTYDYIQLLSRWLAIMPFSTQVLIPASSIPRTARRWRRRLWTIPLAVSSLWQ